MISISKPLGYFSGNPTQLKKIWIFSNEIYISITFKTWTSIRKLGGYKEALF